MTQIAFIWNGINIYWSAIVITAAVLAAMLAAIGFRFLQGEGAVDMVLLLPLALVFSFFSARFVHWYCFYRQYNGFAQAMTDYSVGAFSLPGVFAGVLLAAFVLRLTGLCRDLNSLLDAAAPAAALGIGAGRFSAAFNSFDRGSVIVVDEAFQRLPFSTEITSLTGGSEWHTAVYLWEGIAALAIFAVLTVVFLRGLNRGENRGRVFWLFLLLYGAVEILFDSMRYDSAFLRSNGFVSLVQIIGLGTLIVEIVLFSVNRIRSGGFRAVYPVVWAAFLAGAGLAGFSEYYVQRHGDRYLFAYSLMAVGLVLCVLTVLLVMRPAVGGARRTPYRGRRVG